MLDVVLKYLYTDSVKVMSRIEEESHDGLRNSLTFRS